MRANRPHLPRREKLGNYRETTLCQTTFAEVRALPSFHQSRQFRLGDDGYTSGPRTQTDPQLIMQRREYSAMYQPPLLPSLPRSTPIAPSLSGVEIPN